MGEFGKRGIDAKGDSAPPAVAVPVRTEPLVAESPSDADSALRMVWSVFVAFVVVGVVSPLLAAVMAYAVILPFLSENDIERYSGAVFGWAGLLFFFPALLSAFLLAATVAMRGRIHPLVAGLTGALSMAWLGHMFLGGVPHVIALALISGASIAIVIFGACKSGLLPSS